MNHGCRLAALAALAALNHSMLGHAVAQTPAAASATAPDRSAQLTQCLANLRAGASAARISTADFDRITATAQLVEQTVTSRKAQPEFKDFWWDYVAKAVDDERVSDGQKVLTQWASALTAIEQRYGIDRHVLVAVFGMETNYAAAPGKIPVLDAWLTRACLEGKPMWRANVYASVRILRDGKVPAEHFKGSWSGAFGMTQFIPTSYEAYAADGDGDGVIDTTVSVPDGLASTARYLTTAVRWNKDAAPAFEVKVPNNIAAQLGQGAEVQLQDAATVEQWAARGVQAVSPAALPQGVAAQSVRYQLFAPTGGQGPVFLVSSNFRSILGYNNATKYALSVSFLAHRLRGGAALSTPWPTDDPGLSRAQIRQLQTVLTQRGYDVGTPDGIPGERTRNATVQELQKLNAPGAAALTPTNVRIAYKTYQTIVQADAVRTVGSPAKP